MSPTLPSPVSKGNADSSSAHTAESHRELQVSPLSLLDHAGCSSIRKEDISDLSVHSSRLSPTGPDAAPAGFPSSAHVRSSYAWAAAGILGIQIPVWFVSLWVVRLLQPQDFGLMGMAAVFLAFCRSLQDVGLGDALIQRRELSRKSLDTAFWFLVSVGMLATLLGWVAAPGIAGIYHEPRLIPIVRVLSCSFILIGLRVVPLSLLTKQLDFASRTKAEMLASLSGSLVTVFLAQHGFGVWSLILGATVMDTMLCLLAYWFCLWRPRRHWDLASLSPLLRFGLPAAGSTLLWLLYYQSDFLVIGLLLGPMALGFYTMAWQLSMVVSEKLSAIINKVNFPVLSALQASPQAAARHWVRTSEAVVWISFPALSGLALVSRDFVRIVFTSKWMPGVPVLRILCVLALIRSLSTIMPGLLNALGHPKKSLSFSLAGTLLCPPAFVIGALWAGIFGVGVAWVITYSVLFFWLVRLTLRLSGVYVREYVSPLVPPLLVTAFMSGVVLLVGLVPTPAPLASLILRVGAGVVSYFGCAVFWFWKTGRLSALLAWLRPHPEVRT